FCHIMSKNSGGLVVGQRDRLFVPPKFGKGQWVRSFLIFAKPFSCCFQFFQRILVYFHSWYKFFYFFVKAYKRSICDTSAFLYAFQMGNNFPAFQQCFWSVTINVLENKQDVDRILLKLFSL